MMNENVISLLNDLIQLDIDAVHAYAQAIDNVEESVVRSRLLEFQSDHERHIRELSEVVLEQGGKPIERKRDFKGFLIEGMTAIRSSTGTKGALKAMKTNEVLTNRQYDKALDEDLPPRVRDLVLRNRDDERRHLQYIDSCINSRIADTVRDVHSHM
ncbi:MAG TPA: DUF2383 domain-containing protein [Haliangium sp.]|nr:DUF2383 domain-containing protein [Haliangium sp.]